MVEGVLCENPSMNMGWGDFSRSICHLSIKPGGDSPQHLVFGVKIVSLAVTLFWSVFFDLITLFINRDFNCVLRWKAFFAFLRGICEHKISTFSIRQRLVWHAAGCNTSWQLFFAICSYRLSMRCGCSRESEPHRALMHRSPKFPNAQLERRSAVDSFFSSEWCGQTSTLSKL